MSIRVSLRSRGALLAPLLIVFLLKPASVGAAQAGYCWSDKVGWINMSGVTFEDSTREFSGTATFTSGEIDFTEQGNLTVTLASLEDGSGNYPLIGQAFSEQLGWIVADHGGTGPAAMKPSGELTGNFWSNETGWINCSVSDVGSGNVQIWDFGMATSSSSSSSAGRSSESSGGGGGGGLRSWRNNSSQTSSTPSHSSNGTVASSNSRIDSPRTGFFIDVPKTSWFFSFVQSLATQGIISGYKDADGNLFHLFKPGNSVTYAEAVKMLLLTNGEWADESAEANNVSARNTWASPFIAAVEQKSLSVLFPSLNVHTPATRGAVFQMLLEIWALPPRPEIGNYSDITMDHPYAGAIGTLTLLGIIQGDTDTDGTSTGTVRPNDPINRAELAKILVLMQKRESLFDGILASAPERSSQQPVGGVSLVNTAGLVMRWRPAVDAPFREKLSGGDIVIVIEFIGEWAHIRLPDGRAGYVVAKFLRQD